MIVTLSNTEKISSMKKILFFMVSFMVFGLAACSDDDVKVADDKLADLQKTMDGAYWAVESTDVVVGEGVNLSVEEAYKQGLLMDGAYTIDGMRMGDKDVRLFAFANNRDVYMDQPILGYSEGTLRFSEGQSYREIRIESMGEGRIVVSYWHDRILDREASLASGDVVYKKGSCVRAVLKPATEAQAQKFADSIHILDSYNPKY